MQTLHEIIRDACEELREYDPNDVTEPSDVIHEIADSSVPIYTSDLLELASQSNELALAVPELDPAFDGEPTLVNIIAANVFEAIEAGLWEEWREIKEERENNEV